MSGLDITKDELKQLIRDALLPLSDQVTETDKKVDEVAGTLAEVAVVVHELAKDKDSVSRSDRPQFPNGSSLRG